jgi:hypothetical protein
MKSIARLSICLLLLTISLGAPSALAVNKALSLDGSGDYVDCGNGASLNNMGDFTLESWIYLPNNPADGKYKTIISKHTSDGADNEYAEYDLQVQNNGNLNFFMGNGVSYGTNLNGGVLNTTLLLIARKQLASGGWIGRMEGWKDGGKSSSPNIPIHRYSLLINKVVLILDVGIMLRSH